MLNGGWKTVLIDSKASLSYSEGWLIIRNDEAVFKEY